MKRFFSIFVFGLGLARAVYGRSQVECNAFLSQENLAQAFGQPKKPISIVPGSGCMFPLETINLILNVMPFSEQWWAHNKDQYQRDMHARPISDFGAPAYATPQNTYFVSKNRIAYVELNCGYEDAFCFKLAHAIDRNIMKMKSIKAEAQPEPEPMQSAKSSGIGGDHNATHHLDGFLPDVTICPAEQVMEVNRYNAGNTLGVVWILTGVKEKKVADYYRSTLTKKGWTLQGEELREAAASMKEQAAAAGFHGTQHMTFVKGSDTVEIDVTPAGGGITLNITQTKQ
jgi:hypothetical protein